MKTVRSLLTVLLLAINPLHAQLVADGATNTLNNITNSRPVAIVGTNGSFTLLVLSNNAQIGSTYLGVIGRDASAKSNEVRLVSATARWPLVGFGELYVGSNGPASRLTVSGGGFVQHYSGTVGNGVSSSNNIVLITDPGSLWGSSFINLGSGGGFNQLTVSNGATLQSGVAFVGGATTASNNLVTVTGTGSLWNQSALFFGVGSTGNRITVSAGGRLSCNNSFLGWISSNNTVLVTGSGSSWTNSGYLNVGDGDRGNQLIVSNGASVFVGSDVVVGVVSNATANVATITGTGSQWLVATNIIVGSNGAFNRLVISDGAYAEDLIGSLAAGGASSNNLALIAGSGSLWSNRANVIVGWFGPNNQMLVTNGGSVIVGAGSTIGSQVNARGNMATVTGSGSVWSSGGGLSVGNLGASNRLVIEAGGHVDCANGIIGFGTGSNNVALVTGAGSVWSSASLRIGGFGPGSQLIVSNGAAVVVGLDGFVGHDPGSSNNLAVVTGAGSVWSNSLALNFGYQGARNILVVSNGALLNSSSGVIGASSTSSNNTVFVTGPGSRWNNQTGLDIGIGGVNSRLVISNGGFVDNALGRICQSGGNCEVVVTGPGSVWNNRSNLIVGEFGSFARLTVTNGGSVLALGDVLLGNIFNCCSFSNRIVVDGGTLRATNSTGTSTLAPYHGTNQFNAGVIEADLLRMTNALGIFEFNGGTLITRGGVISNGQSFFVGKGGTTPAIWDVRAGVTNTFVGGDIAIGTNSSFNQLILTNGALLSNTLYGYVGESPNSVSNRATLAGAGSKWLTGYGIIVGDYGSGNRFEVSNGAAAITAGPSGLGSVLGTSNNEAVVTGPGSLWTCGAGDMYVSYNGPGNRLVVSDGGLVGATHTFIGFSESASNNFAMVTGGGSTLTNSIELTVGYFGPGNQLVISNGAFVSAADFTRIGFTATSLRNRLTVDGGTLRVTNASATGLLEIRRGTNVLNAGLIETDILRMTNGALSRLEVNGGTLAIKSSRISAGNPIIIGNGTNPATLHLAGNGTHDLTGTLGLIVTNNATLSGNGSLLVQLQVRPGATLSPGASIGKISVNTAPFLSGTTAMEISKNGLVLTNDQIQLNNNGTLTYGGSLVVSNLGPTALLPGDRFQLFIAGGYAGSFSASALPPLPVPLSWTNKLLVDGSIEVVAPPAIAISSGTYAQSFDSLAMSGGSHPWRDNSTLLGWYAAKTVEPANITNYIVSEGSGISGALYSFGSTGSPERALGSIGSGSVGTLSYGLGFFNDTSVTVSNFNLTFTGEQWRNSSSFNTNTLTFWYRVSPTPIINPEPSIAANWTAVTNLDFASPVVLGAGVPLDGNASPNRQVFASVLLAGLLVTPGQHVFFRWQDIDDPGTDEGMALDDLTVSFSAVISTRAFGVDVSHFQNESGIPQASWDQMFAEGKRFVFVKATEGLTGPHDPTMSNNVTRAVAAGLLAGVYHFAHPENRPTTNGAVLEASNLVVYAGSAIGQGRLRPVLDLEGSAATLSTAALTDWVIAFSDEIIARRGPGAAPIIYCSQTFANNELDSRLADYDLWLRTVGSGADVAFDDPPGQGFADATGVFNNWSFWQYSATGSSGGISPLDLDVCHNEYKPLSSYLIPGQPPAPINLTGVIVTGGGAFQFSFTNTPGASFTVLATTNVSMPVSNWTVLGPITETPPGQFQFSDSQATNHTQRYYRVQSP